MEEITTSRNSSNGLFTHLYERRSSARSNQILQAGAMDGRGDLTVENISMTGMLALAQRARLPGSLFKVQLHFPDLGERVEVWCKVLELLPGDLGGVRHKIQFCCLTPKATMVLYHHLDRTREYWS